MHQNTVISLEDRIAESRSALEEILRGERARCCTPSKVVRVVLRLMRRHSVAPDCMSMAPTQHPPVAAAMTSAATPAIEPHTST